MKVELYKLKVFFSFSSKFVSSLFANVSSHIEKHFVVILQIGVVILQNYGASTIIIYIILYIIYYFINYIIYYFHYYIPLNHILNMCGTYYSGLTLFPHRAKNRHFFP